MNRDENLKAEQFHTVSPGSDFSEDIRKEKDQPKQNKIKTKLHYTKHYYYFILHNRILMACQTKENKEPRIILLFMLFHFTGQNN